MYKYIIVGANPSSSYTGTMTVVGLRIVGKTNNFDELQAIYDRHYTECGALLLIIDSETGSEVQRNDDGSLICAQTLAQLVASRLSKEELKNLAVLLDKDADNDFCFYIQEQCSKVFPEMYVAPQYKHKNAGKKY